MKSIIDLSRLAVLFVPQSLSKTPVVANSNYGGFGVLIFQTEEGGDMNQTLMWDFRARHDLTGADLARMLGVNKSQVSRWETSQRKIPLWVEKFLACLDATLPDKASRGVNPEVVNSQPR